MPEVTGKEDTGLIQFENAVEIEQERKINIEMTKRAEAAENRLEEANTKLAEMESNLKTTREQLTEIKAMVEANIEPKEITNAKPFKTAENNVFWGNFVQKTIDFTSGKTDNTGLEVKKVFWADFIKKTEEYNAQSE